jgi:hypothetical protein
MWLAPPDGAGGLIMVEVKQALEAGDLYASIERWFGERLFAFSRGWRVVAVRIRVVFEPDGKGKREKAVGVELKLPDRTNLRDQTRQHRLIGETLLDRWGVYAEPAA